MHSKFNCITDSFKKTQHGIYVIKILLAFHLPKFLKGSTHGGYMVGTYSTVEKRAKRKPDTTVETT